MESKAEKVLTAKIAREAVQQDDCDLSEYTAIEEAAAQILAKYDGSLILDGLSLITDAVALSLAKHRGDLSLNGLVRLTPEIANALANHRGSYLSLDGLGDPCVRARYLLYLYDRGLPHDEIRRRAFGSPEGLTQLSEEEIQKAVGALANYEGTLRLSGLGVALEMDDSTERFEFSDDLARALGKHKGSLLLWGLESISLECAKKLAQVEGALGLGITTITKPVAEALAQRRGSLWLDGLTELPEEIAVILSAHEGGLSFDGLKTLQLDVARVLAKHRGELSLAGLEEFPPEMFEVFLAHEGKVSVPIVTDIEKVAAAEGDDKREFIVGLDFYYCDVNYSGFQIMDRAEIRGLLAALETDGKIGTPNMPGEWWEEFDIGLLKGCFTIHSPWPSDIEAMRKLFGEWVGQTSLFDSVMEHAPASHAE
jgi:hypothetical protein